jgi:hypothetical protein
LKKSEKIFFGIAFGAVFPVTLFYLGLGISKEPGFENTIYIFPALGFLIGIVLTLLLRKKIFTDIFNIHEFILYAVYIFYSIWLFSFFVYVPIFNLLLSLPTGYYIARKCILSKPENEIPYEIINQYSRFSAYIISVFVVISFFVAINKIENITGNENNLIGYKSNRLVVFYRVAIYFEGLVIFLQYYLTKNIAINFFQRPENNDKTT